MNFNARLITIFLLCFLSLSAQRLADFRHSVYSQWGEDGILKRIFEIIGVRDKICVEFGGADGFWYSNTANLWANDSSWKAYLIEADERWFDKLMNNVINYPHVMPIFARVGIEKKNRLATILGKLPGQIDLLSIDIDSNDYYILKSVGNLKPRVIICEYNPTIPVHIDMRGEYGSDNTIQSSALSLKHAAQEIGYSLVALTTTNAFFVRNEDFEKFAAFETDIEKIDVNKEYYRYLVQTSDGKYIEVQQKKVPWSSNGSMYEPYAPYKAKIEGEVYCCGNR